MAQASREVNVASVEACAIESAYRETDMLEIFVLLNTRYLDLEDNATCKIATQFHDKVKFFQIDLDNLALNTSAFKTETSTYLSDYLRLVHLYEYGGWYADLDFVFLRSLFYDSEAVKWKPNLVAAVFTPPDNNMRLSNCLFRFEAKHEFIKVYMEAFVKQLRRDYAKERRNRAYFGPPLLTSAFKDFCGDWNKNNLSLSSDSRCQDVSILHPSKFIPVRFSKHENPSWLSEPLIDPESHWDELNNDAFAVHFYGSVTRKLKIKRDPTKENYSFLARQSCPTLYKYLE